MNAQRGTAANSVIWTLAGILVIIAAGLHIARSVHHRSVRFGTSYQAVLLANGAVYFGHLQNFEGHHPVLTDVYYIVSQTDPTTKEVNNVLVKRGKELHAPDRMYLNPNQIVFVEPVGADSKVAQLIAQAGH
jgi:hypothetical protein